MPTIRPRLAVYILLAAVGLDLGLGLLFAALEHITVASALYFSVITSATIGYGDVTPHTTGGHIIAVAMALTVVPLFAAEFSLFTTLITAHHLNAHHESLHEKLNHIIHHSPDIPPLDIEKGE